jgi:hypothetical protein
MKTEKFQPNHKNSIKLNGGLKFKNGLKLSHSIGKRISSALSANQLP